MRFNWIQTRVVKNTIIIVEVMRVASTGSDVTPEKVNCTDIRFTNLILATNHLHKIFFLKNAWDRKYLIIC